MRFVVYGAGAIGGVMGARLFQHDHEVVLIARGEHRQRIERDGLRIESPDGSATLPIPVVERPESIDWTDDDVVLLTMKTQDALPALEALQACAPVDVPVVCAQNGVENERQALRRFRRVYGMVVTSPGEHLEPGIVRVYSSPLAGVFDLGRVPDGIDELAERLAGALDGATLSSRVRPDIMRWKWTKLLRNVHNAADALCGPGEAKDVIELARAEAVACLEVVGIDHVSYAELDARRNEAIVPGAIAGASRAAGSTSTSQSLLRRRGSVECDYLNGEIVLLGRLHHVPTPVNEVLQRLVNATARSERPPGSMTVEELWRELASAGVQP